jgi:hypothetical protein
MAKKSSGSSRPAKRVSVSAESTFSKPIASRQEAILARIAKRQAVGNDSAIDFSDIPELAEEELRKARRAPKVLVAARIEPQCHR